MSMTKAMAEMTDEQRRIRRLELRQDATDAKMDLYIELIRAAALDEGSFWSAWAGSPGSRTVAETEKLAVAEEALAAWDRGVA